jgi:hypothetical protein
MRSTLPGRLVTHLSPGPAQVTGWVRASGPPMQAPISGRTCIYYQVIGRNHVWPWHDRRSTPASDVAFWIDDGGGQLLIVVPPSSPKPRVIDDGDPTLDCAVAGDGFRRTIYLGESPALDRLLDPGGLSFPPDAYLHVEERIIAEGDRLTIGGQVIEELTVEGQALNYRSPPMRLVLRARSIRKVGKT